MRILFLAPLPPPLTGHSLVSKVLLEHLQKSHDVTVVDIGRHSQHFGGVTGRRILAVLSLLREVRRGARNCDAIYLTIAESLAGNIKDLCIYLVCLPRLDRVVIHLHGGTIKSHLFDRRPWLRRVNAWFLRRIAGALISGRSHLSIFDGMIARDRVHIVPNFAPEQVFRSDDEIKARFASTNPLRIQYLSLMTPAKGYLVLADGYAALSPATRAKTRLSFAGRFETDEARNAFETRIAGIEGARYEGEVDDAAKRRLFGEAHVFCLPTMFKEGQPISILEAYASGCVVMTTTPPGVLDVFDPEANGVAIEANSAPAIRENIERLLENTSRLEEIGLRNARTARVNYTERKFAGAVMTILESVHQ
jgi:glycosyltransferase involved in cell wall biosynthesis